MAEENFRLVVESAPNALIKSDSKGTIVLVNKQAEKMFGYDREQFTGKNIDILVPHSISSTIIKIGSIIIHSPNPGILEPAVICMLFAVMVQSFL